MYLSILNRWTYIIYESIFVLAYLDWDFLIGHPPHLSGIMLHLPFPHEPWTPSKAPTPKPPQPLCYKPPASASETGEIIRLNNSLQIFIMRKHTQLIKPLRRPSECVRAWMWAALPHEYNFVERSLDSLWRLRRGDDEMLSPHTPLHFHMYTYILHFGVQHTGVFLPCQK